MAGHNKWVKIKRKKGINDAKRGQQFTKLGKAITLAAQQGGGDLETNFLLRLAVQQAKEANMPGDNITRAIKKGTGEIKDGEKVVEVIYEALIDGIALLIKCQTDNTNRSLTDIRQIVEHQYGGKLSPGAVQWQFSEQGQFILQPQVFVPPTQFGKEGSYEPVDVEAMQLNVLDLPGVVDLSIEEDGDHNTFVVVFTEREAFAEISKHFQQLGYKQEDAQIAWLPKEYITLSETQATKLEQLMDTLEDNTDVSNIYHNGK